MKHHRTLAHSSLCRHGNVMECVMSSPGHTPARPPSAAAAAANTLTCFQPKPQLFPFLHMSQESFSERPPAYLE
ncbi:uncharacterized protein V6R79_016740 [Siganus canaliculatus]